MAEVAGREADVRLECREALASEAARRAVDNAVLIHGACGFIKDYIVEKLYRDQRVTEIYEGTSEIQPLVIARSVLGK